MASNATVKVGVKEVVNEPKLVKEKKEKPEFDLSTALDENGNAISLNEGRLSALPANVPEGTQGLKRNSFSTKILYAEYQRARLIAQEDKIAKRIQDKDAEIIELKTGGDPRMKKVKRVMKLKAQLDALFEALKADGIDPSDYGIDK